MDIKLLGAHNSDSANTRFISLLLDDKLAIDAGGLTSGLSFDAQRDIKAVLLTHQHYDHIRDLPGFIHGFYLTGEHIAMYSTLPTYEVLATHLFSGKIYPNFLERPEGNPTAKYNIIEPDKEIDIEGYRVLAIPVNHSDPTVGYQVKSQDGKVLFYTGDTGPDLIGCWEKISPQLLIIEVTAPNRFEEKATESGHLTPDLLKRELLCFKEIRGYLPHVIAVHMAPELEEEIKAEIEIVSEELKIPITIGFEGMQLHL
jgi:ribonuclease BN (tRNA processing enzyme)